MRDQDHKILFIAPRLPVPADTGGKIRTLNILKQLAQRCEVDLICFSFEAEDRKDSRELEALGVEVALVDTKEQSMFLKAFHALFNTLPYSAYKYYSRDMEEGIRLLVNKSNYDLIHFDHIHMAHYFECLNGKPSIVDEHNVEYRILERCADVEKNVFKKRLFLSQAGKMKGFEEAQLKKASGCCSVSEDDREILDDLTGRKIPAHVIPNGVDTGYFDSQDIAEQNEEAVVFTGSMDWFPNNDAALHFCKDVLPLIWEKKPKMKFYVVGKGPSAELQELSRSDKRIIVAGRVDDVRTFMGKSKVFVVPLRIGGGTRIKILEAMSMKRAVVSTSIGAEGIDYQDGGNILIADAAQDFADSVVDLLDNSVKSSALGDQGRDLVLQKYDWSIVGNKLIEIYKGIITG